VLAALDQHRRPRAGRIAESAALDHAQAGGMPGVDQKVAGNAQLLRESDALFAALPVHAADHDRAARLGHGMQVEQVVGRIDKGPQLARAAQLGGVARAEQHLVRPDAVVVLVDAARAVRVLEVEAGESRDVGEGQEKFSYSYLGFFPKQEIKSNGTAILVPMRQGLDHDGRAGPARVEHVDVIDAGVAGPVPGNVGRRDFDRSLVFHRVFFSSRRSQDRFLCKTPNPSVFVIVFSSM
jgi:hypothetical protein